jgi:hypothetical protein
MSVKYCHQIKENGTICRSAALRGRDYCYFHLRLRTRRLAMAQAQSRGERWRLQLPALEDMHAVQAGLMQVMDALAADAIDARRAGLLLYGLQQASCNVRAVAGWMGASRFQVAHDDEMRAESYPGLEREFDLPKGLNVDTPPEVAFPPPAEPTVALGEAPVDFEVTPLDLELTEIDEREGAAGVSRRLKQISASEDRKLRKKRKQLEHARRLLQAAARNAEWVARCQRNVTWPRPVKEEEEPYDFATVVHGTTAGGKKDERAGRLSKKPPKGEEKTAARAKKLS